MTRMTRQGSDEWLRDEIFYNQHEGPLGEVHEALYHARDLLLYELFPPNGRLPPLISLAVEESPWRGKYESVGAFGIEDVITINVRKFDTALDAGITLAHEMAHWHLYPDVSHDVLWQSTMKVAFGIEHDSTGKYVGQSGKWHDLNAGLMQLGLGEFRFMA